MAFSTKLLVLLAIWTHSFSDAQFITFDKDGKLGVNFAGYHAGVGIGGSKGLFAEAGTPFGQHAAAGLGGNVDGNGRSTGGLYAGATAGGNVRAAAGLGGSAGDDGSAGGLYAGAQAGPKVAASGLAGQTNSEGGFSYTKTKTKSSGVIPVAVDVRNEAAPVDSNPDVIPLKPVHKKVHKEIESESVNYVTPVEPVPEAPVRSVAEVTKHVEIKTNAQPVYKEVYVPPPVIYKRLHHRPRHHFKHAYISSYAGGAVSPQEPAVVYKTVPVVEKRIDTVVEGHAQAGSDAAVQVAPANIGYTKTVQVAHNRSPTFFADIFNIPIQTLSAVGKFLGNAASGTSVSVQKTASVQAEDGSRSDVGKVHGSGTFAVETPAASSLIEDIFAIPINTLGAVNRFLENNAQNRKKIQTVIEENGPVQVSPKAG